MSEESLQNTIEFKIRSGESLKEDFVINCIYQVLSGIRHLHDNQIVHNNIKPSNISVFCVNDKLSFKLRDSRFLGGSRTKRSILGSRHFQPPELIENGIYNYSGDVWEVGVLLFYMTTFTHPFVGETDDEILE